MAKKEEPKEPTLGEQIEQCVLDEMRTAIRKHLEASWNGPAATVVNQVIASRSEMLKKRIETILDGALESEAFDVVVKEEFGHKLGKALVAKMGGAVEKQVNDLLANPATRARLTLALDNLLREVVKEAKE